MILFLFTVPIITIIIISLFWKWNTNFNTPSDLFQNRSPLDSQFQQAVHLDRDPSDLAAQVQDINKPNATIISTLDDNKDSMPVLNETQNFWIVAFIIKVLTLVSFSITFLYCLFLLTILTFQGNTEVLDYFYITPWTSFIVNYYLLPDCDIYSSFTYSINNIVIFELSAISNVPFIALSSFILIIALLTTWNLKVNMALFCCLLLLLEICLFGCFSCCNLFIFLLFFEASAIPLFILLIYCGSERKERVKANYFFFFYTSYGSLALLSVFINTYALSLDYFELPGGSSSPILWFLMLTIFAVKIPLYPIHSWLLQAHVEASTSTSIVLASLMLKIGGFGIIRFMLPHFIPEVHVELIPYISLALLCGCLYTSLNTLRQIDLKRFIAFGSIMHMTLAIIAVFTLCETGIKAAIYMMISHGFIAASLFFLIGTLTERYHNRSSLAYSGLLAVMPVFGFYFLLASLANIGFPGTSGFIPEFGAILSILSQVSFTSLLHTMPLVLLSMFIMTASTFTLYLRLFFGSIKINYITSRPLDLTKKDFVIMAILLIPIFILGWNDVLFRR